MAETMIMALEFPCVSVPVSQKLGCLISIAAALARALASLGGSPWCKPPSLDVAFLDVASLGGGSTHRKSVSGGGLSPRQPTHRL